MTSLHTASALPAEMPLGELEKELEQVGAERSRLYWLFSRAARARPVPAAVTRRFYALQAEVFKRRRAHTTTGKP